MSSPTVVIVAALNEEEGIGPTLAEVGRFLDRPLCLVVDGHSTDRTVERAKAHGALVVAQGGTGKGDAVATAVARIKDAGSDFVVFIDADHTYPPEHLSGMIGLLKKNPDLGMICGNRFGRRPSLNSMGNLFYFGNRFLAFIHNLFNGVHLEDPLTGLRVVRHKIIRDWGPRSKGFDIEVELNSYVEKKGYGILEVPIHYRQRLGQKKLKPRHGFLILRRILLESMGK